MHGILLEIIVNAESSRHLQLGMQLSQLKCAQVHAEGKQRLTMMQLIGFIGT